MTEITTDKWWLSPLNLRVQDGFSLPERVVVHDTTLRDGEQMAGVIFNKADKVDIARKLDEVGVDRIEAGNVAISEAEREAIKAVAREGLKAKVMCLCRSVKDDIDLALECDVSGVVVYSPAGSLQLERKFHWTEERAVDVPVEASEYAKAHGLYVVYFPFDTTRADLGFVSRLIKAVVEEARVDSVVAVDTVGCALPQATSYLIREMRKMVSVPVEIHCHNDFGMATANSLAGVAAGAEVVHTAVNGIGERVGNAALEEVALGLRFLLGMDLNLKLEKLYELSRLVEDRSGVKLSVCKPLVGENAFRFEAGLVVDGIVKFPLTFIPLMPEVVGQRGISLLLGKKSGKASIQVKLKEMGVSATEDQVTKILGEVKRKAEEAKRVLSDEEFKAIVKHVTGS